MATQTASSSSSSSWKYDVFLSFCGVDTRKNFTGHLYTVLEQKGILTFKDDEKLDRGKYISSELLKAIEESKYAIIVLSKNYAFSRWCLIELVKIVECMKVSKLTVLPVFYHVDPSNVRNQMGTFAQAFEKHEKDSKVNKDDIQAWKAALKEVGNISGWHLHDRLLPELPSNIEYIDAEGCISLETLPARPEDNFLCLRLFNCVKMIDNEGYDNLFLTMLRHDLFKRPDYDRICVLVPENNIPKWFSHQSEGASLNLQGPSDFLGIAVCLVYVLHQHPSEFLKLHRWITCHFYFKEYEHSPVSFIGFTEEFGKIDSYHLWLGYFPIKDFGLKREKKLIQSDADVSQIEFRFESEGPGLEVVKCGVHLTYNEDLNHTMAVSVCSNCNVTPYEADFEDSVKVTKMKRSSDNYHRDEAGLSGEGIPR
ncbi:disease resistance protein RPP2B-like isoform X4 [Quercus robur]|uniref:disease resistance protein RPP2B-like isoform X4 n=1 Tax=Quercus robur TaxID=38942 RepID=UPI0021626310|nr:disease resistance protein RPP2B-like isoform X4 [Quercus robur]